ncbi:Fic family protein [Kamptonema sp. UHCC 0994]|uniref:type II toxin-antitoxin system death-on-curing family toxin n=1 Tax=Kamptonema sp. UHCC 0994 TaxID=3031329 RepID=UPI0023B9B4E7|nr:Fic family protein [Kamptonema sp. UHCC 0994]MDF0551888.1 Fic family protein [Kamptonema sp. UHCC 0994]
MVLIIHARQIEKFGGSQGIRDEGLLESALAQPQSTFGGELLHPTIQDQAAAYFYHLAMNHPFIDGNKRTAYFDCDRKVVDTHRNRVSQTNIRFSTEILLRNPVSNLIARNF